MSSNSKEKGFFFPVPLVLRQMPFILLIIKQKNWHLIKEAVFTFLGRISVWILLDYLKEHNVFKM